MDDDGGLGGFRNWDGGAYYDQHMKGLGLQLMPSAPPERDTKPLLSNGVFLHHHHHQSHRGSGVPEHTTVPMEYMRAGDGGGGWIHHQRDNNNSNNKILHVIPVNHHHHHPLHQHHHSNYAAVLADNPNAAHTLQMMQPPLPPPDPPNNDKVATAMDDAINGGITAMKGTPLKKRSSQGRAQKSPKPKKPKKVPAPREDSNGNGVLIPRGKAARKSTGLVINGIDMDISTLPTPVCSCTGTPQPCYRWGVGGWQSACCTTSMSVYPLPMSTKRRGARIAGRKMSQGAFKKVLEKLAGEGYNLSNPIDLRGHWAKHGTNKFVTIR